MGQTIFGGSKQQSTSSSNNQAFPLLSQPLQGVLNNGVNSGNQIANMLGLNGGAAQNEGFTNWQNSTGYQFGKQQGMDSITGNAAASGLLNSGGNEKALETYGQNYANTQYGNYNNMLQSLLGSGLQGAGTLANAGFQSQSQGSGSSSPGISKFIGQMMGKGAGGGGGGS